jgi:hypothetical protein
MVAPASTKIASLRIVTSLILQPKAASINADWLQKVRVSLQTRKRSGPRAVP